ncbi:alcohol dehydrogenase-like protein [Astrocystis sublimbata]|nr:alcohol dehydrogenase-like protein [Astrocystis sublimbata]
MAVPDIPKTHKACIYDKVGSCSIAIKDVPTPEPGPGEVLVKLTHSGICHSDYSIMTNQLTAFPLPTPENQIGGHEGLGHIVKLGEGCDDTLVQVGDRVGIKWVSKACLKCQPCEEGMDGLCLDQKTSGYYTPGTFQQYVIGPANYVTPVPESIPGELAAPLLCAGLTVYSALRKCNTTKGQWIVISGAGGGLGSIATSIANGAFGLRVIGIDMPSKREGVLEIGAEHFIDITAFDDKTIGKEVMRITGPGASAVMVCTNKNQAYSQALSMLKFGGTMVCVGLPEGEPVPISTACPNNIITRQHKIVGSVVGNRQEAIETMELAKRGVVKMAVRSVGMGELQSVFEDMSQGKITGRVVLDMSL